MKLTNSFFSISKEKQDASNTENSTCPSTNQTAEQITDLDLKELLSTKPLESEETVCSGQNEELNSPTSMPNDNEKSINVSSIEDVLHMSFDSDEDEAKLKEEIKSNQKTNEIDEIIKDDETEFDKTIKHSAHDSLRDKNNLNKSIEDSLNEGFHIDASISSDILNNSVTDNCDIRENADNSMLEKSYLSDCTIVETSPNTSISKKIKIEINSAVSTGGLVNSKFELKRLNNSFNSSSIKTVSSSGGFLGRLARFRNDAKNIADIDKPKTKEVEVNLKTENGGILDRFRENNAESNENSHAEDRTDVMEDVDGKDEVDVVREDEPASAGNKENLSPWGSSVEDNSRLVHDCCKLLL